MNQVIMMPSIQDYEPKYKQACFNCKHLSVIISLMGDYWCSKNYRFFCIDDLSNVCDDFTFDDIALAEKEEKVWG